ncbi:hypothetical protein FB567DRAFT_532275 [Paraphoma chrysanthemicola]|uniref:Ubiquitin-like domain-containing protein n=1 Tax=Paraphoma chrysanthemicola TaxID=798071 RepID=A0A8K0R1B0_9PLEO|nr:hypothetical protein FB567DRAFT_532275 [Paraphoma chrysanthemicola]
MAEEQTTIHLKVLSPSTEVEGGVTFADIPATTTIKELRSRIQDAVPSKPAPERMRLIYRGRVVANDADTLGHVFGADNIRESKEQSLHLVLRELPPSGPTSSSASPAPRSSTAPPNPFRPAQAPIPASPPLQTNPFRTLPQPRPNSQPQAVPHQHHHHPHVHHHHLQGPPNPFQIPLPPAVQQQLAQTMGMAQNGQGNNGQAPGPPGTQPGEGAPAPAPGPQAPPVGLPPLPGFGPPNLPPNGRTVRQEGIGPNGERWSVTYSSANIPAGGLNPHQPLHLPHPPAFGLPPRPAGSPAPTEAFERLLPRMRDILQSARRELDNLRVLIQAQANQEAPGSSPAQLPVWRLDRIRQHIQVMSSNLNLVERGLGVIAADAAMTDNAEVVSMRQSATELRSELEQVNQSISQQGATAPSQVPPSGSLLTSPSPAAAASAPIPGTSLQQDTHVTVPTLPSSAPEELFLLSSPQGPVGILFDQRGTYMTAPMVPTLPFQTFTNQFAQNRQLIAGLGQQIAQGSHQLHNHLATIQPTPTPTQQPPPAAPAHGQPQPATHDALQPQPQDANQAQPADPNAQPMAPGGNDGIANLGGHLWLLFKLACFVYFFSGTGWYKSIFLGVIAGAVYLAQLGLFEQQFALIRRHFEALLPVGALAERAAQPVNQRAQAQPGHNLTPEEAARRLMAQRQQQGVGWVRESMRSVERACAIFLASLWPGIGERMVHAQEERLRLERVAAEEERERREEEERQRSQEGGESTDGKKDGIAADNEASSSTKGKERAVPAEEEGKTEGQAIAEGESANTN